MHRPAKPSSRSGRKIGNNQVGRNPVNVGLPKVSAGDAMSANHINRLAQGIDSATLRDGIGYRVKRTSGGTTIELVNDGGSGSTMPSLTPFSGTDKDGNKVVYVKAGTVNQVIPQIDGTYIDSMNKPSLSVSADGKIYVKVTKDDNLFFPATVEIIFVDGESDDPVDTDDEGYFLLASVNYTASGDPNSNPSIIISNYSQGSLCVNRLKTGDNTAIWTWGTFGTQVASQVKTSV